MTVAAPSNVVDFSTYQQAKRNHDLLASMTAVTNFWTCMVLNNLHYTPPMLMFYGFRYLTETNR